VKLDTLYSNIFSTNTAVSSDNPHNYNSITDTFRKNQTPRQNQKVNKAISAFRAEKKPIAGSNTPPPPQQQNFNPQAQRALEVEETDRAVKL